MPANTFDHASVSASLVARLLLPEADYLRPDQTATGAHDVTIIVSFAICTLEHFLIGASKTIVTGLSPWRSGAEMTIVGLGEASITGGLGLMVRRVVG